MPHGLGLMMRGFVEHLPDWRVPSGQTTLGDGAEVFAWTDQNEQMARRGASTLHEFEILNGFVRSYRAVYRWPAPAGASGSVDGMVEGTLREGTAKPGNWVFGVYPRKRCRSPSMGEERTARRESVTGFGMWWKKCGRWSPG